MWPNFLNSGINGGILAGLLPSKHSMCSYVWDAPKISHLLLLEPQFFTLEIPNISTIFKGRGLTWYIFIWYSTPYIQLNRGYSRWRSFLGKIGPVHLLHDTWYLIIVTRWLSLFIVIQNIVNDSKYFVFAQNCSNQTKGLHFNIQNCWQTCYLLASLRFCSTSYIIDMS